MKKTIIIFVIIAAGVLSTLFCACKKGEVEDSIVPLQLTQQVKVFVQDAQKRDLLSDNSFAFKESDIEVRYKKGGKPYFNNALSSGKRGFTLIKDEKTAYLNLSLSTTTKRISNTDKSTRYETTAYVTFKDNGEKEIKVHYEEDKSKSNSLSTLVPKTLKVWVDGNVAWEHDNTKEDLDSYQSKITLTLTPPKR